MSSCLDFPDILFKIYLCNSLVINKKNYKYMKKLVLFLVSLLMLHVQSFSQTYSHIENICEGSTFTWTFDIPSTSTIIIETMYVENNNICYRYDTIVGNEVQITPSSVQMPIYLVKKINGIVPQCAEQLEFFYHGVPQATISYDESNLHINMDNNCKNIHIINNSNGSLAYHNNWSYPPNTIDVNNLPSGNYSAIFTDNSGYNCRVTIPITIP